MSWTPLAHAGHTNSPTYRQAIRQTWLRPVVAEPHGSSPMLSKNLFYALPHQRHLNISSKGKAYCLLPKCRKKNFDQLNRALQLPLSFLLSLIDRYWIVNTPTCYTLSDQSCAWSFLAYRCNRGCQNIVLICRQPTVVTGIHNRLNVLSRWLW